MFRAWSGWGARALQMMVLCVLSVAMLGAGDTASRFDRVGHQMVCPCGCTQVLVECNHVGCPDSERMTGELRAQLAAGGTDSMILNWFANKYGATVLGAPIRAGFDRVAWIAPFTAFLFATLGMAFLIKVWRQRAVPTPAVGRGDDEADALRERIRRETEY